jgi:hypothetical protein
MELPLGNLMYVSRRVRFQASTAMKLSRTTWSGKDCSADSGGYGKCGMGCVDGAGGVRITILVRRYLLRVSYGMWKSIEKPGNRPEKSVVLTFWTQTSTA